jgi:hypothetical protein
MMMVSWNLRSLLDLYRNNEMISVRVLSLFSLNEILLTGCQGVPGRYGLTVANILPVPIISVVHPTIGSSDESEISHVVLSIKL